MSRVLQHALALHIPRRAGVQAAGRCRAGILSAALTFGLIASAAAQAPVQLSPAPPTSPPAAPKPAAKQPPRRPAATAPTPPAAPAAQVPATPVPAASRREPDMAFGAFQRGYYMTAFDIAIRRADELKDVRAMTLLGELYANGLGIDRNDKKAANWYQLAADRGDREAMFALAMFHIGGRLGTINRELGAKLLASAAKLGQPARRRPEIRNPNTRSPPSTRKAAACRRIWPRRRGCWPRRRLPTTPMPRSNTPSRCSTARASPGTSRWRRRC
jgi:hypothetical protein